MGAAVYRRGSKAIAESIRRDRRVTRCPGTIGHTHTCTTCGGAGTCDQNEGDRCLRNTGDVTRIDYVIVDGKVRRA